MLKQTKVAYVLKAFARIKNNEVRMARGHSLRAYMYKEIEKGLDPTGYRPKWIQKSGLKIMKLLRILTYDFNVQHSDDKVSNVDLDDVLRYARKLLKH